MEKTRKVYRQSGDYMKVYVFPADRYACGFYRMIWPSWELQRQGYDVVVVPPSSRNGYMHAVPDAHGGIKDVVVPEDADVIVMQRLTQSKMIPSVLKMRQKGIAVVVDIDDDLNAIHPDNVAFQIIHPRDKMHPDHNWLNTQKICESSSAVMVSAESLLPIYASHGRGHVLHNRVPTRYTELNVPHDDVWGWTGSLHSHPDDLQVLGNAGTRLCRDGYRMRVVGPGDGVKSALYLDNEPTVTGVVDLETAYPDLVGTMSVGITPLSDTKFNTSKSWLKPLEMASVGVVPVMSPRAEYARLHREGIGRLAAKPSHWYREVKALMENDELRIEMSDAGRAIVKEKYTIEANAWRWYEVWDQAFKFERKRWSPFGHRT